jgi:hypothetical protein
LKACVVPVEISDLPLQLRGRLLGLRSIQWTPGLAMQAFAALTADPALQCNSKRRLLCSYLRAHYLLMYKCNTRFISTVAYVHVTAQPLYSRPCILTACRAVASCQHVSALVKCSGVPRHILSVSVQQCLQKRFNLKTKVTRLSNVWSTCSP